MAEVHLDLLTTGSVLCRMPSTTASYHMGTPRPTTALPQIKAMALLMILPRVTQNLSKVAGMRCDEGFSVLRCNRVCDILVLRRVQILLS
jgi:hypothetical protein